MPRVENKNDRLLGEIGMKVLRAKFPELSFERLLCRPRMAIAFCRCVRSQLGGNKRADEEILWTILNRRKMGHFAKPKLPEAEVAHVR